MKTLLIAFSLSTLFLTAADQSKTWTDPETALREDPDFAIQGEYHRKGAPVGGQVVALGNGKFDLYVLEGGLPGLGWNKSKPRTKLTGGLKEGAVTFAASKGLSALLEGKTLTIQKEGKDSIKLARISRQSPTLDAKAPVGATVLFDGSSVAHWQNGKMEGGLLQATGATSKPKFKDYKLHLEFRTPYKPFARGQGRGNSGVYFGGRWETQVLDSFALDGKMNECGGIYSIAEPDVNACLPPLTWQTYDVDFTAAKFDENGKRTAWPRMTVRLNGVTIHQDRELPKDNTTAAPGKGALKDEPLPVYLQNHGNPVVFRNIWVLPKK
ncbi:DUF1080 domain-containing protein [Akkermansiaceae bacterium]|nr:DUF1080 domain-containing protein [Akkermansiaceae bacterium]MDB4383153.1 DUF1080 domain-containing protein [Akkermansiaceae bacterium]